MPLPRVPRRRLGLVRPKATGTGGSPPEVAGRCTGDSRAREARERAVVPPLEERSGVGGGMEPGPALALSWAATASAMSSPTMLSSSRLRRRSRLFRRRQTLLAWNVGSASTLVCLVPLARRWGLGAGAGSGTGGRMPATSAAAWDADAAILPRKQPQR